MNGQKEIQQPAAYTCKHGCERDALKDQIFALENSLPCIVAEKESDLVVVIRDLVTVLDLLRTGRAQKYDRVQSRCNSMVEVESMIRRAQAVLDSASTE